MKEELKKALIELRKEKERKFDQTVDLIINLQKFDVKKNSVNLVISVPNKIKEKKVCGFLESKNKNIDVITPEEFKKYHDKKELKKVTSKYDFFIAQGSVMPKVATTFGRFLGPAGKMPSPQLGIVLNADDKTISGTIQKINNSVKIKTKEASIKIPIGKQSMDDEKIIENILSVYQIILKSLPKNKENVKNIELKFTMTKPVKINLK
jgi:large subunit ribosomal protein L1